jgi:SAM-dependent methyltransferase
VSHFVWDARHGVEVQDRQNELPAVRAAKEYSAGLLRGGHRVLDIGCGTGRDLSDLGAGALGIDASREMVGLAAGRGATVGQADARALPFRSGSFGGVRIDRVLYHLPDPERALAEAARVLRPGGVLVCCHPDYESFVLEVPGAPAHLVALAKRTRIDLNYLDAAIPRRVPRLLLELGLRDVTTEAFALVVADPDEPSLSVPTWLRDWRDRGRITLTDDELSAWDHAVDRARDEGGYLASLTYLLTHGVRN